MDIGNITSKTGVGTYSYTGAQSGCSYTGLTAQPHAVRNAGGNIYCYDANGNMIRRLGATVTWSTYNYPLTINQTGGNTTTFHYGADRNLYRQVAVDGAVMEDRVTVAGGAFERLVRTGGSSAGTEFRHFIQVAGKPVAIVKRSAQTGNDTFYLHEDHLGSTDVITNATGAVVWRTSFDAWGQRRGSNWTGAPSAAEKTATSAVTHVGYTGHEQLDNLNLVHMKGRVYDPVIARFISADPIIQDPYHSQSFNRYSYIWNNPLNSTDPTGFERCNRRLPARASLGRLHARLQGIMARAMVQSGRVGRRTAKPFEVHRRRRKEEQRSGWQVRWKETLRPPETNGYRISQPVLLRPHPEPAVRHTSYPSHLSGTQWRLASRRFDRANEFHCISTSQDSTLADGSGQSDGGVCTQPRVAHASLLDYRC